MANGWSYRCSCQEVFCKKGVFKNFAKLTTFFIKKETLAQMFSCEFYEIFESTFFIEHLRWLLLELCLTIHVRWDLLETFFGNFSQFTKFSQWVIEERRRKEGGRIALVQNLSTSITFNKYNLIKSWKTTCFFCLFFFNFFFFFFFFWGSAV